MKSTTPTVIVGCILVLAAVTLLFSNPFYGERETHPTQLPNAKSSRSPLSATASRYNKKEEPPLSPTARTLLRQLTEAIQTGEKSSLLVKECGKAGVRASDFLNLASQIRATPSRLGTWNLELILAAAAERDGRATAEWYDQNVSREFLEQHEWVGFHTLFLTVAISWLQPEPREAIRWAAAHDHLSVGATATWNIDQILVYWPQSDFAGQIDWIEREARARSGLATRLDPAVGFWAKEDPVAAVRWMESFVERENYDWGIRQQGYEAISRGWPAARLTEAAEWLMARPQRTVEYDDARIVVAERLAAANPLSSMEIANDISDRRRGEREDLVVDAAQNLYRSDPATVIDWLRESGLSEDAQRAILDDDPRLAVQE